MMLGLYREKFYGTRDIIFRLLGQRPGRGRKIVNQTINLHTLVIYTHGSESFVILIVISANFSARMSSVVCFTIKFVPLYSVQHEER